MLSKISQRELRLVLLGIGAVLTTAALMLLVVPNVKALRAADKQVLVLERAGNDSGKLEQHLDEQLAKIEELKYQLDGDMANLPVREVESYVIGRLQRVSWSNDVELVSVEPATGERVQIFQELLFNVQLVGEYDDLYRWMLDAREDLGYLVVKEYELRRQDNEDLNPRLLANLSLASYKAMP